MVRNKSLLALAFVLAVGMTAAPTLHAEDTPPGKDVEAGKAEPGAEKSAKILRIVRARRVLDALQEAYDKARAQPEIDEKLLARLEAALVDARALTKAITLDELTEGERKALAKELAKLDKEDGEDDEEKEERRDPRNDWTQRALERAFDGAGLNEEEERKATPIISEWYPKSMAAWRERDSKKQSDLKRERDKQLKKALGRKKAQKIINNLNSLGGRR